VQSYGTQPVGSGCGGASARGFTGATDVVREARALLGDQFSSVTFMYVLMRAFEVEYAVACDASRWHEFHGRPRALSDADLGALLAPWR